MKAVLVLDEMPESCEDCPLNYDMITCLFVPNSDTVSMDSERLNDCPLRKLPGRSLYQDITLYNLRNLPDGYEMSTTFKLGCNIGYNAYRDMLLGTNWED